MCQLLNLQKDHTRFEVLPLVLLKFQVSWDITLPQLVQSYWQFKGVYCLQGQALKDENKQHTKTKIAGMPMTSEDNVYVSKPLPPEQS
jgi:hypothetical protein